MRIPKSKRRIATWLSPKKLERVLPWTLIGVAVTVYGLPAFQSREPRVEIEIRSVSNILDLHRPLPELTVLFNGSNIQDEGKNLQIVTLTLRNSGNQHVLQGDYDQSQPFGVKFLDAQIVGIPRVIYTDSDYLTSNLLPKESDGSRIEFGKVILEEGMSGTFEVLILHDQSKAPTVHPFGKIAGQDKIDVVDRRDASMPTFFEVLFSGGIWHNLARLFISLAFTIIAILIIILFENWLMRIKMRKRIKIAKKYLETNFPEIEPKDRIVILHLLNQGRDNVSLKALIRTLQNPELIQEIGKQALIDRELYNLQESHQKERKENPSSSDRAVSDLVHISDLLIERNQDQFVLRPITETSILLLEKSLKNPPPQDIPWFRLFDESEWISPD